MKTPKENQNSPWGKIQHVQELAPEIWFIQTASHGGVKLSPDRNKQVPHYMRKNGGWYEEDCDYAIPFTIFQNELKLQNQDHIQTLKSWHPDKYEKFFNTKLLPGESYTRDKQLFDLQNKNNWVTTSAYGSWHENVSEGYVGVIATLGGTRTPNTPEKAFLIKEHKYSNRNFSYVINLQEDTEIPVHLLK